MGYSDGSTHATTMNLSKNYMNKNTEGNFDGQFKRIVNLAPSISDNDALTQGQVSNTYLSLNGGTLRGNLNLSTNEIRNVMTYPTHDHSVVNKKFVQNNYRKDLAASIMWGLFECSHYSVSYDFSRSKYFTMDTTSRKLNTVKDQGRGGFDGTASNTGGTDIRPTICTDNQRVNARFYAIFRGTQRINSPISLNKMPLNTPGWKADIAVVTIVYKLTSLNGSLQDWRCALWYVDNSGYKSFVCFSPNGHLLISGSADNNNTYVVVSPSLTAARWKNLPPIGYFTDKAAPSVLNKRHVLTVLFDRRSGATNKSLVVCNGEVLRNFTARDISGSTKYHGAI